MNKLRRERSDDNTYLHYLQPSPRHLRIVASGTLFQTITLKLPYQPAPSTTIRAQSVEKTRGGSANVVLSLVAQFPNVEAILMAPLGGNEEGRTVLRDLENERVNTQYCKVWKDAGVPSAWVLHSVDDNSKTVVNHNPLPDITHEDFIALLGPLLAPENYIESPSASSTSLPATSRPSQSSSRPSTTTNTHSPAPFDWLHFEGRSVKTTLSNITGLDGLARERKWRSHCVFSIDVGRRGKQGVEALLPHADVLFFNKQYAEANNPHYETTPRAFLLSLAATAPPHALLVAYWGSDGAAVLSLPTKEYFQSSGWVEDLPPPPPPPPVHPQAIDESRAGNRLVDRNGEAHSVRSGSDFWAGGRNTPSSRATSHYETIDGGHRRPFSDAFSSSQFMSDEDDRDSEGTERPERHERTDGIVDEIGPQDAFVSGMIYALSRRLLPGLPWTPAWSGEDDGGPEDDRGRWKLDECLRFATELSGRKARRKGWAGLAQEMAQAGWIE